MAAQVPNPTTAPVPRYHSKTAYSILADQADAIICSSAYHRKDFDRAVIWFPSRTHNNSIISVVSEVRQPIKPLGELDNLPLEIINDICLRLDMRSIVYLRQVNARARHVVNALHEYMVVTTHALNPFCALLRAGLASRDTLSEFYSLLCTQICSLCNAQYGDLVYLPTWIRCCSHCLESEHPRLWIKPYKGG